jgi:hypothetical protein
MRTPSQWWSEEIKQKPERLAKWVTTYFWVILAVLYLVVFSFRMSRLDARIRLLELRVTSLEVSEPGAGVEEMRELLPSKSSTENQGQAKP